MTDEAALTVVKVAHTVIWAFFVACIVGAPIAAWSGNFTVAWILVGIVAIEALVLLFNRWACPLTGIAARYTAQREANFRLLVLGVGAVVVVFLLLWKCLDSWAAALQVLLVNIPLAAVGSVAALMILNRPDWAALQAAHWWEWPKVWAQATTLSVAHWVGFITLIGIVCRNGIMMICHFQHLERVEGEPFGVGLVLRGARERISPILMTASATALALVPLLVAGTIPGHEIEHPMAVVIMGGLVTSTLMNLLVMPSLYLRFARPMAKTAPETIA